MSFHYTITFDGGSRGNGSKMAEAYGSYQIQAQDGRERITRLQFPTGSTNNEAEYDSLIAGLEDLVGVIKAAGKDPGSYGIRVQGDSQLVIKHVTEEWQAKATNLVPRCQKARTLLAEFGNVAVVWQLRERSVAILGH